jgi:hypothetical protein
MIISIMHKFNDKFNIIIGRVDVVEVAKVICQVIIIRPLTFIKLNISNAICLINSSVVY